MSELARDERSEQFKLCREAMISISALQGHCRVAVMNATLSL